MARTLVKELTDKKNYLINGNFEFWQRNTSFSASGYSADRWYASISGTATIARNTSAPPSGSAANLRYTSSGGASFNILQALEDITLLPLKGKVVTVSVKIKRNSTYNANFILALEKNATANTALGGTWSTVATTTIVNVDIPTVNYLTVSITATVPNDGTANGLRVYLGHSGSANNGSTLDVSQVMLTEGSVTPTEFVRAGANYTEELFLCQRYYTIIGNTKHTGWIRDSDDTFATDGSNLPTTMRVGPVATVGPLTGYVLHAPNELSVFPTTLNCVVMTANHYYFSGTATNALTGAVRVMEFSGGTTRFDAEL